MKNRKCVIFGYVGSAGEYDDVTDVIIINMSRWLYRYFPKMVLFHELRHMIYLNYLHPEYKGKSNNLWIRIKAELFAGFPY